MLSPLSADTLLARTSACLALGQHGGRASRCTPRAAAAPAAGPEQVTRRQQLALVLSGCLLGAAPRALAEAEAAPGEFAQYTDPREGFRISYPRGWEQASKAGAAVLFKERSPDAPEVGVTVTPVRIPSLERFGSPEEVGSRLLAAEKAKESTKEASMLSVTRTAGAEGQGPTYNYDYRIDTTRGRKRVLSSVTIAAAKLYIANGTIKCGAGSAAWDGAPPVVGLVERTVQSLRVL